MNPEQLLRHFDRISEAPDAIPKLRQFILDLAVRGKLVIQDPHDEPIADLLFRIAIEKVRLVRDGQFRNQPSFELLALEEIPFQIPDNWTWIRLGQIGFTQTGTTPPSDHPEFFGDYIPFLKPAALNGAMIDYSGPGLSKLGIEQSRYIPRNSVLMVCIGSSIGKVNVTQRDICCNQQINAISPCIESLASFLSIVLRSDYFQKLVRANAGMGTLPILSKSKWEVLPIPLPPLAEQHRIASKVGELMELCNRLAVAKEQRESRRNILVSASLHHLNNGTNVVESRKHVCFYLHHLPDLTTRTEHTESLRRTILNLAIRGQLVPQESCDEPASELLKQIHLEKVQLLREGKIKRQTSTIQGRADELGYELKTGWQAARFSQILVELQTGPFGSSLHQSDYQKDGIPVINPASIKNERILPMAGMAVGPETLERLATFKLRAGDIVMGRRGEMGRCAVVTEQEEGWLCGTGSLVLRLAKCVFPRFIVMLIGSPSIRKYLGGSAVGSTMQNLNQGILLNLVMGLPPLAEQHRIVGKVDQLMALCDQLDAQLANAQNQTQRFLEAVLHSALKVNDHYELAALAETT